MRRSSLFFEDRVSIITVDLRPGARVRDRYELVKLLGEGGQGSVWEARDLRAGGALRALKLVRRDSTDPAAFQRAQREAEILWSLKLPGLVGCHEFFADRDNGLVGLVLEHVNCMSLAQVAGRMSVRHRLSALRQVAVVLAHVHAKELVHRDLRPQNVLITEGFWERPDAEGTVKLVDFGIAAPVGNPKPLTALGEVFGSVRYRAPELFGLPLRSRADEGCARDVFAFGVMAWELLRGEHPTRLGPGATAQDFVDFYARAGQRSWPPRGLEGAWDDAIAKCLALHPEDRLQDGAGIVHVLENSERNARGSMPSAPRISTRTLTQTDLMTERASSPPVSAPRSMPTASMQPMGVRFTPPPPSAPPQRSMSGPVWALALAVALLAGVLAWRLSPRSEEPDATSIIPLPQNTPGSVVPASTPSEVCCGGVKCTAPAKKVEGSQCETMPDRCKGCTSGRTKVQNACSEYLNLDHAWRLRLARLDTTRSIKDVKVCIRKGDSPEETCMDAEHGADVPRANRQLNMAQRLPITTRDLVNHPGLDITIKAPDGSSEHERHARHQDGTLLTSALCIGTRLAVGNSFVAFYLDDP
ncbi:serine/threonine protein kinase [Polyangium aurulentum]|uniref:serine/threonine protein kinase n=1 Tax=Polyangium aurulentum TaxID=2567896 RepID=UPI001469BA28|nr:serine/threonine-protein kinase [Polyangium aurulentum]UQA61272.1 serine/threonine protein kinase [Polyangium aurulentum]